MLRAKGSLARANAGRLAPEVLYEDLCFDAQQAAEKALKALLLACKRPFPKTHDIGLLLQQLVAAGIDVPEEVCAAEVLSFYAVVTRYPGDYPDLDEAAYLEALELARRVVAWVEAQLEC
ncbi:HEPN domain-containing protein [Meiothermus taiwanensis]|uniref:HEPN domain-containing protein n=1 Tax=Meiothermus taiwanensis TaxID=172827 RepID=UPI00289B7237